MSQNTNDFISVHPLDAGDAQLVDKMRIMAATAKGVARCVEGRGQFDALMASVLAPSNVKPEADTIGGVPGIWVRPANARPGCVLLHLHGGWFNFGSAAAFANLVGQIARHLDGHAAWVRRSRWRLESGRPSDGGGRRLPRRKATGARESIKFPNNLPICQATS